MAKSKYSAEERKNFKPGGHKGKLHRELGVPEDQPIGKARIARATHSRNPAIARDAKRAETMGKWDHSHGGGFKAAKQGR